MSAPGTVLAATVRRSDADGVEVLLDDGTPREVPAGAVDPRLRHLRPGQRVHLEHDGSGHVQALTLPGGPLPDPGPTGPPGARTMTA